MTPIETLARWLNVRLTHDAHLTMRDDEAEALRALLAKAEPVATPATDAMTDREALTEASEMIRVYGEHRRDMAIFDAADAAIFDTVRAKLLALAERIAPEPVLLPTREGWWLVDGRDSRSLVLVETVRGVPYIVTPGMLPKQVKPRKVITYTPVFVPEGETRGE